MTPITGSWASVAAAVLASCGVPSGVETLPPRARPDPIAAADEPLTLASPVDTEPAEPPAADPCSLPWPDDPDDPRVGVYVREPPRGEPTFDDSLLPAFVFDGSTVVNTFGGVHPRYASGCRYPMNHGQLEERMAEPPIYRYHARAHPEGWLYILYPCEGWLTAGFFDVSGFEGMGHPTWGRMRRLHVDGLEELRASLRRVTDPLLYFECRDPYETPGVSLPPLPGPTAADRALRRRLLRRRAREPRR